MSLQFQQLPARKYNGLTIVASNPSRFDLTEGKLFAGNAGTFFKYNCLNGILFENCFVTLAEYPVALLKDTKVVLLLGEHALRKYCPWLDKSISLNAQRGNIIKSETGIIYLASYLPQDTFDMKAEYETRNNQYLAQRASSSQEDSDGEYETGDDKEDESETKTTKGRTRRANYRFWLKADCIKTIGLLTGKLQPQSIDTTKFRIYENSEDIIYELRRHKRGEIYFDIETDRLRHITCFSFNFEGEDTTWGVPLIRYDYSPAYTNVPEILLALAYALYNNCVVGHNIASFDLFVMAHDYRLPIGRHHYDTMLAHHRVVPEVERSLGHCISYYCCLEYHKNEGVFEPRNLSEERQLWEYNCKDTVTTKMVRKGIDAAAIKIRATESISQVNASIRPYLIMSLQGIRFDRKKLTEIVSENDQRMMAVLRIIKWMVGYEVLPSSNLQCTKYFHDVCGLPVIDRSKKTQKPSLAEDKLLKLYVKASHPLIPLFILFRQIQKETSTLGFTEWLPSRDTCEWVLSGTDTYRLGSRKRFREFGGNLQNKSYAVRRIYLADTCET